MSTLKRYCQTLPYLRLLYSHLLIYKLSVNNRKRCGIVSKHHKLRPAVQDDILRKAVRTEHVEEEGLRNLESRVQGGEWNEPAGLGEPIYHHQDHGVSPEDRQVSDKVHCQVGPAASPGTSSGMSLPTGGVRTWVVCGWKGVPR